MAVRMSGKEVSQAVRERLAARVAALGAGGIVPGLAVVIAGEDGPSKIYVREKHKACGELGIHSEEYALPESTTQAELLALVERLNQREDIHGILVQLPLPGHLEEESVIGAISPEKDVDAFHPVNVGKILLGKEGFAPCTPAGIMEMLDHYGIDPAGKRCVVIGRSNIVGKPMGLLLLHRHGTVTICHSRTEGLADICREADILVAAVGKAGFVTGEMVKTGAVVIDVGMNRNAGGKLCGDVDYASVEPKAGYITPVPGGVGPMTITALLENTVWAAEKMGQK